MLEFRNKRTSEYRKVEEGSDEHLALLKERQPEAPQRTVWEQVGRHTHEAFEERLETGALETTDFGDDDQPINRGDGDTRNNRERLDITPTKDVARQTPTAAERATGAGRASEGANLDTRLRGADGARREEVDDDDDLDLDVTPEPEHPEHRLNPDGKTIAEIEESRSSDGNAGDSTDDDSDDQPDYGAESVEELQREADKRGLDVEGSGSGGNVLKDDLVKALRADDKSKSE